MSPPTTPTAPCAPQWTTCVLDYGEDDVRAWMHALPKCELHAHLSGSIGARTIAALERMQAINASTSNEAGAPTATATDATLATGATREAMRAALREHLDPKDLAACFRVFSHLHRLLNSLEALALATQHVLEDFAADNCAYLELRTTPRVFALNSSSSSSSRSTSTTTKAQYVETIVRAIEYAETHVRTASGLPFRARLLLSVDRRQTLDEAFDTVELAHTFAQRTPAYVVGIDFSGDPTAQRSFAEFLSAFARARSYDLRCTVHCAEVADDLDTWCILRDFAPDRLGHMVCFTPAMFAHLLAGDSRVAHGRIPIEICPTSNLITQSVRSFEEHPFGDFLAHNYPMSICTDDQGVFEITLTGEYERMARSFRLTFERVWELAVGAFTFAFDGEGGDGGGDCAFMRQIRAQRQGVLNERLVHMRRG